MAGVNHTGRRWRGSLGRQNVDAWIKWSCELKVIFVLSDKVGSLLTLVPNCPVVVRFDGVLAR